MPHTPVIVFIESIFVWAEVAHKKRHKYVFGYIPPLVFTFHVI